MTEDYTSQRGRKRLWTYVGWLKRRAQELDRKCGFMRRRAQAISDNLRASKPPRIKARNDKGQFAREATSK